MKSPMSDIASYIVLFYESNELQLIMLHSNRKNKLTTHAEASPDYGGEVLPLSM
jgi:hypothetical protein